MKICIALHQVMDLGGIINHTEQLIGGLKDLGHQVDLKELVYADNVHEQRKEGPFYVGPSGIPHHQGKGWNFPRRNRIAYKTSAGLSTAIQILNRYDLVIWTIPVPSKNATNRGNNRWPELYDLNAKQIAFIHDGNAEQGYPHLMHIVDKIDGFACVHGAALGSTDHLEKPRAMILNPQEDPVRSYWTWDRKRPGFFNMQTFKAWKHVHELIESIAYMKPREREELRSIAGRGIEYQYMTSLDKCKPQYFHGKNDEWFSEMKIWEAAEQNGMIHHDYLDVEQVDDYLQTARILVDPSWSKKYSKYGGHFNRVGVDAMIRGCVVVAHKLGMGDGFFIPGEHYIDLSEARDPQDYAEIITSASQMDPYESRRYIENTRELLPLFDREKVAQEVIDLAHGEYKGAILVGKHNPKIWEKADDILFNHFGILS